MAEYDLTYDYGKGEVPTAFEEFAAYVNRPVYEVRAALHKFAGLFSPEPLIKIINCRKNRL